MILKLAANPGIGHLKTRTFAKLYSKGEAAATDENIALGSGEVGQFLRGEKTASSHYPSTEDSLLHRETGVQQGHNIPRAIAKHFQKDADPNLYFQTCGLEERKRKAREADKWKPRALA